jgi:hypothetical protein
MARDLWSEACQAMFLYGHVGPLAKLISGTSPIPPRVREDLGRMLDPNTDPEIFDRLVFSRSRHLERKIKKNQDKIAIGVAVLDRIKAGELRKKAIGGIMHDWGVSSSYVEECMKEAKILAKQSVDARLHRTLPTYFLDYARATLAMHSPHRTGPRKKKLNPRKNNNKSTPANS